MLKNLIDNIGKIWKCDSKILKGAYKTMISSDIVK